MCYRRGTGTLVLVPHVVQKGHRDSTTCATEGAQGP